MTDVHIWHGGRLDDLQDALVRTWLPGLRLRSDMSWGPAGTAVLDVDSAVGRVVIKAGGASNHHIDREIEAFHGFTAPLTRNGTASRLLHHNRDAKLLVIAYLDGSLVQGSAAEFSPDTYVQAGRLASALHRQRSVWMPPGIAMRSPNPLHGWTSRTTYRQRWRPGYVAFSLPTRQHLWSWCPHTATGNLATGSSRTTR